MNPELERVQAPGKAPAAITDDSMLRFRNTGHRKLMRQRTTQLAKAGKRCHDTAAAAE
jgi:hypothetical protein